MTCLTPAAPPGQPCRPDLTALVFRALYQGFDLHVVGSLYVVVPRGTCCFAGPSLGEIACQISAVPSSVPDGDMSDQPRSRQDGSS